MPGSIRQRHDRGPNTFELRVFLGRDREGHVRHHSEFFRGTRKQAELALAHLVAKLDGGPAPEPHAPAEWGTKTTVNDAIAGWKANGWEDLSPTTARRYESIWRVHIKDSIGPRALVTLSPYDVEVFFRALKSKGLSRASVRYARAVLHRSCRLARKWSGNTLPNPVADTELPDWKLREQPDEVRAPQPGEVQALLAAVGKDKRHQRIAAFIRVIAATGMRRGEACALRWDDLDFDAATVRIDESIITAGGGVLVKDPKSKAGIRRLALDATTMESLRALRQEMTRLCGLAEVALEGRHFVFTSELPGNTPPYPDAMSRSFARVRVEAGVAPDVHLHSLRHFQATALDSVISEAQKQARLGWSTVHMARHYTDVIGEEDRRAAEHVGCLLAGEENDEPQTAHTASPGAA